MPFDPTLPQTNAPIVSAELRNQFNALNDHLTGLDDITNNFAMSTNGVAQLSLAISNPPTQAEVQALRDKINEMLQVMFH